MSTYLFFHESKESNLNDFPIVNGTIIYCTDTHNTYLDAYDIRLRVSNIVYIDEQDHFDRLIEYIDNILYIVLEPEVKYYIPTNNTIKEVHTYEELQGTVIQDPSTLIPTIIRDDSGYQYAPRTLASLVYDRDGNTLDNVIDKLRLDTKHLQKTISKTKIVIGYRRIFIIPYPTHYFDIENDSMLVVIKFVGTNKEVVIPPDLYVINANQIIFNTGLTTGDELTFIFHYSIVINQNDVPEKSVGFSGLDDELYDIIKNVDSPDPSNIILDNGLSVEDVLKGVTDDMGNIGNPNDIGDKTLMGKVNLLMNTMTSLISNIDTKASQSSVDELKNVINTNSNNIQSTLDTIETALNGEGGGIINKIQRGVSSIEASKQEREIRIEPVNPDKCLVIITGDSYYNETPYLWSIEGNTLHIRQKSIVSNENYVSNFSWQIIEFI